MADKKINIENERQYLSNLANTGTSGQKAWAEAKAKEYGLTLAQPQAVVPQTATPTATSSVPNTNDLNSLIQWSQQNADANFMQQKANLDSALEAQIAQLKMAYQQAVADGEISIRDAEIDFKNQEQAIRQQAYTDSQRTNLYAQDMGIQNSQQMIGLMQGDNARTNSLINTNMTTRDKRIADIKTKLNSIKNQQFIDISKAQSDHMYNVLNAKATAQQQASQNIFGLLSDDYKFNRQASHDVDMFNRETQRSFDMLDASHQKDLEKMAINFSNDISKMNIQQGFDLEKINLSFKNELSAMAKQYGYQKELQAIEQSGKLQIMEKQQELLFAQMEKELELKRRQLTAIYTKGTPEYLAAERELELEAKKQANAIMTQNAIDAWSQIVLNNPNLPEYGSEALTEPYNYYDSLSDLVFPGTAALQNWITGYDKKMKAYNKEQQAIKMVQDYFNKAGLNNIQWTTDPKKSAYERPKISAYERYLKSIQK